MIYNSCMARCAFAVVKNKDGKILLVQIAPPFREDHKWNFPGGVIEDGEEIPNFLPSNFTAKV